MSAAELDEHVIDILRTVSGEGDLGILLGAGASLAAGLPGWDQLAQRLLVDSGAISDAETARAFLETQDAVLAAEAARSTSSNWGDLLRKSLYGPDLEQPKSTPLHQAIAWLASERGLIKTRLCTLNFDLLLESAFQELNPPVATFTRGSDSPRAQGSQVEINHLHGALPLDAEGTDGVILTLSDYTEMNRNPHPWQVGALQDITQRGPLILAGTSYRDPDIRQWLSNLRSHSEFQALIFLAREGFGLSKQEFETVKRALTEQWEAIGVTVIVTEDHADAAQAFTEMLHINDKGYVPPRMRARALWKVHEREFSFRQKEYSRQLAVDVERLRPHLGHQANLTLWLADGQGQIARWAANDRVYNSVDVLRRIEPGFDSKWVVGQCLGRDETLAQPLDAGATQRWRSVVAQPVWTSVTGGPLFAAAALSTATPLDLDEMDADTQDSWTETVAELSAEWGERLANLA